MKKIAVQFMVLILVVVGLCFLNGRTPGWIEPAEEESNGDIILSGQMYSGKVVVNITLHPDGTGEHEGNGESVDATWEPGSDDVAMVVRFNVKDTDYEMNVYDTGSGYTAEYPIVAGMTLTGAKPVKDIILSGEKWSGKVVIKVTLHADGTGEHEGNGETVDATWEEGGEDAAMVVHFNIKGTDYDMFVTDEGETYSALYPLVADLVLTGAKTGGASAPAADGKEAEADVPEETTAEEGATEEAAAEEGSDEPSFPANTFVLPFTADINEQLSTTFHVEPSVWESALGTTGSYTPAESQDLLFSWTGAGASNEMDFFADGTYEFRFTKMSITEHGTWSYADGNLVVTSEAGREMPAELTAAKEPAAEEEPLEESAAEEGSDEPSFPANTFVLPFTADINEQLSTTFHAEPSVWESALGTTGSYTPAESQDLLFSWTGAGASNEMDFFADGTYEYRFTKMSITEHGTWSYADGNLVVTSEAGREMPASLTE